MNDKIAELESTIAFQDNTIEKLNQVVIQQQFRIDSLEKGLAEVNIQLKNLTPSMQATETEETPPPHY